MKWYQGTMLTFLVIDVCVSAVKHGEYYAHNGGASLIVAVMYFIVLYAGGFWD